MRKILPFLVAILAILAGCKDGPTGPDLEQEDDEVIISDETVVIDPEEAQLDQVSGDTLVFSASGSVTEVEAGDIVVGEEGEGFLRRVSSAEIEGNSLTLVTEQASLVDAVERGTLSESFDMSGSKSGGSQWKAVETAEGVTVTAKNSTLGFGLDNVVVSSGSDADLDVVFTNGSVEFNPSFDIALEIGDSKVRKLRLATTGQLQFSTDVKVTAYQALTTNVELELGEVSAGNPWVSFIGFVPVIVVPTMKFIAGYESTYDQSGTVTTGVESSNTITLGAEYNSGAWSPISEREKALEARPFEWGSAITAEGKAYVRVQPTFKFYGVAGPFINAGPYLSLAAEVNTETWMWGLYSGLDAGFGGEVEIFDNSLAKYEHTFSLAEVEIASDEGEREGGGDDEGNGEGGLVAHYPFNGDATDATGNGYDGTVNGPTLTTDRFGNQQSAYSFDGQNDRISFGVDEFDGVFNDGAYTLNMWFVKNEDSFKYEALFSHSVVTRDQRFYTTNRNAVGWRNQNEGQRFSTGTSVFSDAVWTMVTYTYSPENQEMKIFIDGELQATKVASNWSDISHAYEIGDNSRSEHNRTWNGSIDDVRIYDQALSESEIQDLFTEGGWDGSGLVSRWPGEDDADDVVDGNSGTPRGNVSFASGVEGQAFQMDGSEDTGILVGDRSNLEGLEQLTVAAWVKTSNPSGNRSIVAKHFREDPPPSYILRTYHDDNSGRVSFGVKTGSSGRLLSNEIISSKTIADGQFHFVVGTYDGAEMKLYVDGEAEASKSLSGIIQDSEYPVVIGNAGTAQGEIAPRPSFDGLIDDVRIYDRALSTNEVQALFEDSGGDAVLQSR